MPQSKLEPIHLIVILDVDHQDAFFSQAGRRYQGLFLEDLSGEEEYFVGDNPIPESMCAWASVKIRGHIEGDRKSFGLSFNSNLVDAETVELLGDLKEQIDNALEMGVSANVDLTETLRSLGWVVSMP